MAKMMQRGQLILGRYVIEDHIAEGGQASVTKALDQHTGSKVVVKQLIASLGDPGYDQALARFQRMAQIRLGHPNVVDPIDFGEENGEHYIIMPFHEGCNLEHYIAAKGGRLPIEEALFIAVEMAKGLQALHDNGVVHRDVKPPNVLITSDNKVLVTDLGICRVLTHQTITTGSDLQGSLYWMSPEQVLKPGSEDHRSDLYSLGEVTCFMITGAKPSQGNDPGTILLNICQQVPQPLRQLDPSIPEHIDQACMRLLVKQPEGRFQSAREFIQAVQGVAQPVVGSFCSSCGVSSHPDSNYCPKCGANCEMSQNQAACCLACGCPVNGDAICPGCNKPFSRSGHRLSFTTGPLTGSVFLIPEGIFYVGRNELASRDHHISRRHFSVACSNGTVHVQDAGSTNKTYVAGQVAFRPTMLRPNQQLAVAGNTATYTCN